LSSHRCRIGAARPPGGPGAVRGSGAVPGGRVHLRLGLVQQADLEQPTEASAEEASVEEDSGELDIDEDFSLDFEASDLGFETDENETAEQAEDSTGQIELDADQVDLVRHGHRIPAEPGSAGWARGLSEQGDLLALLEAAEGEDFWQPRKVFITT